MTLANMRENGVRSLAVRCDQCHHEKIINADHWPGALTVPPFCRNAVFEAPKFYDALRSISDRNLNGSSELEGIGYEYVRKGTSGRRGRAFLGAINS
jgi:hypothetical protein